MNRGVFESSLPVQQPMMAGNPNWWSINNNMRPPTSTPHQNLHHHLQQPPQPQPPATSTFLSYPPSILFSSPSSTTSSLPISIPAWLDQNQIPPDSWSQLLLGGLVGGYEEKSHMMMMNPLIQANKNNKLDMWEEQVLSLNNNSNHIEQPATGANYHPHHDSVVDVKQENSSSSSAYSIYGHGSDTDFQPPLTKPSWSHQIMPPPPVASSPPSNNKSCVTTTSPTNSLIANNNNSMLDFATSTKADIGIRHPPPDHSHQCNNSGNGGAVKKARIQTSSSSQSSSSCFKVRKEKLGDRITALHQLVSPFGKTDTASVLLEAIGYIRFLQSQIEALSLPYLNGGSGNFRQQQPVQGERNCIFPEDPGQLLNDSFVKRKGAPDQQDSLEEPKVKDLRNRGLCLVPVSCTLQVGSDNGADYWAPAFGGGGFR